MNPLPVPHALYLAEPALPWLAGFLVPENPDYRVELTAEEARIIEGSSSQRRIAEFASGRKAAHEAVRLLKPSIEDAPILKLPSGAPVADSAVHISIAHTHGAACAIAGLGTKCHAVAIDIEAQGRIVSADTVQRFAARAEQRWIGSGPFREHEAALRVFSAKECGFKLLTTLGSAPKTVTGITVSWSDSAEAFRIEGAENVGDIRSITCSGYIVSWMVAENATR